MKKWKYGNIFIFKYFFICLSSIQVALDITHLEGLMFNTSGMCLKLYDIRKDFDLVNTAL